MRFLIPAGGQEEQITTTQSEECANSGLQVDDEQTKDNNNIMLIEQGDPFPGKRFMLLQMQMLMDWLSLLDPVLASLQHYRLLHFHNGMACHLISYYSYISYHNSILQENTEGSWKTTRIPHLTTRVSLPTSLPFQPPLN
jgi:hypothetical protein